MIEVEIAGKKQKQKQKQNKTKNLHFQIRSRSPSQVTSRGVRVPSSHNFGNLGGQLKTR